MGDVKRWAVGFGSAVLAAAGGAVIGVGLAAAHPTGRSVACGVSVKAMDGTKIAINQYVQDDMHFAPGVTTVKSGCMLTFEFGSTGQMDPHTLSIVNDSQLPKTVAQVENCKLCQQIGAKHVKNPNAPPGPTNPVLHWIVNAGQPGLDAPGDSIAILEGPGAPPGHKSVTVPVSAPAGTTLHFFCAVHPWMQGTIKVT